MRKIAIYTGNRSEYGLQYPIIRAIAQRPDLEYYLLLSGAHLQEDFGYTRGEIEKDGFTVYAEVKLQAVDDSVYGTVQSIGSGILSLSRILADIKPDFLVVYGDRFEGLSAVITGSQMNIPVAHIEGGDLTEGGALDDSVRHAMTKLSHLHFTTNREAAERVGRLGEEDWRIHNVGFPALDLIAEGNYASPQELSLRYGIHEDLPVVLFTQHSVTTEFTLASQQVQPSLEAMQRLAHEDVQVIITYPNNDAGGRAIIDQIESLHNKNLKNIQIHRSLGRYNYHGILNLCGKAGRGVCVGNSSSGIKETPAFFCPTVNIGTRQQGRLRGANVMDVPYASQPIYEACRQAIDDESFRKICRETDNPYGAGGAGPRIANVLATVELGTGLLRKRMIH